MSGLVTPFRHIRELVFGEPKAAPFAAALQISRPHLSRLESGESPSHALMVRVRELAQARGVQWQDSFFFEVPEHIRAREDVQ